MALDPDEPFFTVAASSRFAGMTLRLFSSLRRIAGEITPEDDHKNREHAANMDVWHKERKFGPRRPGKEIGKAS